MPLYETVFITRQDLTVDDVDALSEKFAKIISEGKGKLVSKEYWGLRTLSYKIHKSSRGHYVLLNIDAPFPAVAELNRIMKYNEDIIRSETFKVSAHEKESPMFLSVNAKDYKPGKKPVQKEPNKFDLIADQVQFEV
jgi:small subunit ribosomal protein S6